MKILTVVLGLALASLLVAVLYLKKRLRGILSSNHILDDNFTNLRNEYNSLKIKYKELLTECDQLTNAQQMWQIEKKRMQMQIDQLRIRTHQSDILKSNFLSNMSHEIRTPMNGIMGFAQLLKDETDKERRDRYIDIIYHNGLLLVNLIDDIIDVTKIDTDKLTINKTKCNIDDLMFDLYTFFNEIKFKQEKEHINIRLLNLNDDESTIVYTDGQRLRQVLSNLIGNAVKFTEKGHVDFGYIVKSEEQLINFFVRDTGIGIPDEQRDVVFDRFRQVQEGSNRKYGGTGIGLYLCKAIVEMLGGQIWFDSTVGEGSTFYFSIPYNEITFTIDNTTHQADYRSFDWHDKTILVAEDVETNFKYIKTVLTDTRAKILWARNGKEAVTIMHQNNPSIDLILMDIQMPLMDGYEATRQIRKLPSEVPIIAQTAYAFYNDCSKCRAVGCNDYIAKPIDADLLKQKILRCFATSLKVVDKPADFHEPGQ